MDVINNVQLKFQLEADRKQREYAERRRAHTDAFRHAFAHWQEDVSRVRAQLLRVLVSRYLRSGPHTSHPGPTSPAA